MTHPLHILADRVEGLSDFDPVTIMREFYLSRYYEPKAERPADNVRAAIEFTLDRYFVDLREQGPAELVGILSSRLLANAKRAGLYVGITIQPADPELRAIAANQENPGDAR